MSTLYEYLLKYRYLKLLVYLLFFVSGTVVYAHHHPIESFGYNSSNPIEGTIPLLTIMVDYSDASFSPDHTPAFYEDLLFGDELLGNIGGTDGYFAENSDGKFHFTNAGVVGPYEHQDNPLTKGDESTIKCAWGAIGKPSGNPAHPAHIRPGCGQWIWDNYESEWVNRSLHKMLANAILYASNPDGNLATDDGFPFADYDTNGDGEITSDELMVLFIGAADPTPLDTGNMGDGGATRQTFPSSIALPDVAVRMDVPFGIENVSAATIAHEFTHMFFSMLGGNYELYGAGSARGICLNYAYTLMSCTIETAVDVRDSYHLDPFSKMKLGWLRPEIVHVSDNVCKELNPIEMPSDLSPNRAYILYDEVRGPNEFFLLEYRDPCVAGCMNYDGDPFRVGSTALANQGLGIWYVQIDAEGWPFNINALDGTLNADRSPAKDTTVFLVHPTAEATPGNWGKANNASGFWNVPDGSAVPVWLNGDPTGASIRVMAQRTQRGGKKQLFVQLGGEPSCIDTPPAGTPLEHATVAAGVDRWSHEDFNVTRATSPYPVLANQGFTVTWTLERSTANSLRQGQITIEDSLPDGFVPDGQMGSTVVFPEIPAFGQSASQIYVVDNNRDLHGGIVINSTLEVTPPANSNDPPETIEFDSLLAVQNINRLYGINPPIGDVDYTNKAPAVPKLKSPENGAQDQDAGDLTLQWYKTTDDDQDPVSYKLTLCNNPEYAACQSVDVEPITNKVLVKSAGFGAGLGVALLTWIGVRGRRGRRYFYYVIPVAAVFSLYACDGLFGDDNEAKNGKDNIVNVDPEILQVRFEDLQSGTVYYWHVTAQDDKGGVSDSAIWQFRTK